MIDQSCVLNVSLPFSIAACHAVFGDQPKPGIDLAQNVAEVLRNIWKCRIEVVVLVTGTEVQSTIACSLILQIHSLLLSLLSIFILDFLFAPHCFIKINSISIIIGFLALHISDLSAVFDKQHGGLCKESSWCYD